MAAERAARTHVPLAVTEQKGLPDMTTPSIADVDAGEAPSEWTAAAPALEGALRRIALLEDRIAALVVAIEDATPDDHLPAEWRRRACTSFRGYLAYGPPALTHEGYHAAEGMARQHVRVCTWDRRRGPCSLCADWERRLRR